MKSGSGIRRVKPTRGAVQGMRTTDSPFGVGRRKPVKSIGRLAHLHYDPVTGRRRSRGTP